MTGLRSLLCCCPERCSYRVGTATLYNVSITATFYAYVDISAGNVDAILYADASGPESDAFAKGAMVASARTVTPLPACESRRCFLYTAFNV
jgi:hypothetical protein